MLFVMVQIGVRKLENVTVSNSLYFILLIFLENTSPFFVGPLKPLFWISSDVSSGFQSQSGQPYSFN